MATDRCCHVMDNEGKTESPGLLGKSASCGAGYNASILQRIARATLISLTNRCLRFGCKRTQPHSQPAPVRLHRLPVCANCNQRAFTAVAVVLISPFAKQNAAEHGCGFVLIYPVRKVSGMQIYAISYANIFMSGANTDFLLR